MTRTATLVPSPTRFRSLEHPAILAHAGGQRPDPEMRDRLAVLVEVKAPLPRLHQLQRCALGQDELGARRNPERPCELVRIVTIRSEEHKSEFQTLMRYSYAVICLIKKIKTKNKTC